MFEKRIVNIFRLETEFSSIIRKFNIIIRTIGVPEVVVVGAWGGGQLAQFPSTRDLNASLLRLKYETNLPTTKKARTRLADNTAQQAGYSHVPYLGIRPGNKPYLHTYVVNYNICIRKCTRICVLIIRRYLYCSNNEIMQCIWVPHLVCLAFGYSFGNRVRHYQITLFTRSYAITLRIPLMLYRSLFSDDRRRRTVHNTYGEVRRRSDVSCRARKLCR